MPITAWVKYLVIYMIIEGDTGLGGGGGGGEKLGCVGGSLFPHTNDLCQPTNRGSKFLFIAWHDMYLLPYVCPFDPLTLESKVGIVKNISTYKASKPISSNYKCCSSP
jgi:hypothetical protein